MKPQRSLLVGRTTAFCSDPVQPAQRVCFPSRCRVLISGGTNRSSRFSSPRVLLTFASYGSSVFLPDPRNTETGPATTSAFRHQVSVQNNRPGEDAGKGLSSAAVANAGCYGCVEQKYKRMSGFKATFQHYLLPVSRGYTKTHCTSSLGVICSSLYCH